MAKDHEPGANPTVIQGTLAIGGAVSPGHHDPNTATVTGNLALSSAASSAVEPLALYWRGVDLLHRNRFQEARSCFQQVLVQLPDHLGALSKCGLTLQRLKLHGEALACFEKALAQVPEDSQLIRLRGDALMDLDRLEEALACYEQGARLSPGDPMVHAKKGHVLVELKRIEEAVACYSEAYRLQPDYSCLLGLLIYNKLKLADWQDLDVLMSRLQEFLAPHQDQSLRVATPFSILALVDSPSLHRRVAEQWFSWKLAGIQRYRAFTPRAPRGPLRIGYFSADYGNHPVSHMLEDLLQAHGPDKVEIHGFSLRQRDDWDAMSTHMANLFGPRFHDVSQLDDPGVAAYARQQGIDIAVDLMGYTSYNRAALFSHGCAPVQIGYLGYPATLGGDSLDYLVADRVIIPEADQGHYREKIVYLPRSYLVNNQRRQPPNPALGRRDFGLPESGVVYCCFNSSYKIMPEVFEAWMCILRQVPGSVLWLLRDQAKVMENLGRAAEQQGVAASRLHFSPPLAEEIFLGRYQVADLFLDTLPYNAHSTASDALKCGLPVLTRIGRAFPGRAAASLLRTLGLAEWVVPSLENYVGKAVELGLNEGLRHDVRQKLAAALATTRLFDARALAANMEAAYETMYQRFCQGLPAESFGVEDI